jgi:hypothetical protein
MIRKLKGWPAMATFVLVPGAGGVSWSRHRVVPLLEEAGHEAIAVDLPGDDAQAGLSVYAERVLEAIGTRGGDPCRAIARRLQRTAGRRDELACGCSCS